MTKDEFFTHCVLTIGPPPPSASTSKCMAMLEYWHQATVVGMAETRPPFMDWVRWWEKNHDEKLREPR